MRYQNLVSVREVTADAGSAAASVRRCSQSKNLNWRDIPPSRYAALPVRAAHL